MNKALLTCLLSISTATKGADVTPKFEGEWIITESRVELDDDSLGEYIYEGHVHHWMIEKDKDTPEGESPKLFGRWFTNETSFNSSIAEKYVSIVMDDTTT